jgi:hypothetical protein
VRARLTLPPDVAEALAGGPDERLLGAGPPPRRAGSTLRIRLSPHDAGIWGFRD